MKSYWHQFSNPTPKDLERRPGDGKLLYLAIKPNAISQGVPVGSDDAAASHSDVGAFEDAITDSRKSGGGNPRSQI